MGNYKAATVKSKLFEAMGVIWGAFRRNILFT
jgi:hypothetical protein